MTTTTFKVILALSVIFFFGGIAMIVAGGTCTGIDPRCHIPLWSSITILVIGIIIFILSILGFVLLFFALVAGITYQVSS